MVRREKRVNKLKGIDDIHSRLHHQLTPLPTPSLQRSTTVFWTLTWHHYLVSIPEGKCGVSTNKPTSTYLGSTLHTEDHVGFPLCARSLHSISLTQLTPLVLCHLDLWVWVGIDWVVSFESCKTSGWIILQLWLIIAIQTWQPSNKL
jgi:hypothetical protein